MKKNILLSIFALCGYISLSAQEEYEYIPFVRDCEFGYYNYSWGDINGFSHYCMKGNMEFEGKSYKGFYYYIDKENTELIGYVREEDKKVYLRQGDRDWLWYDFTLQAGDMITVVEDSPFFQSLSENEVSKTETLDFLGKSRVHISFLNSNNYWVEGIGDMEELPLSVIAPEPTCPCGNRMFYIKENGTFIYRQETHWGGDVPINDPFLDDAGINQIATPSLLITQYPEQWIVTLPDENYRMVEVVDSTGRVAWCEYIDGNTDSIVIPIANLAQGIYIVVLTSQVGERATQKIVLK